jgi:hypothetical protein
MPQVMETILAKVSDADNEAKELLGVVPGIVITSKGQYEEAGAILKEVVAKKKFLDEERKVSVTPLNTEVKRINDAFRGPISKLESIELQIKKLMGAFVMQQEAERKRLQDEAEAAARAALTTQAEPMSQAMALMQRSADAEAPAVSGISAKPRWTFKVADATKLRPEFLMQVPNMQAIEAWVAAHGDKDVPEGVEVEPDVRFIVRR